MLVQVTLINIHKLHIPGMFSTWRWFMHFVEKFLNIFSAFFCSEWQYNFFSRESINIYSLLILLD